MSSSRGSRAAVFESYVDSIRIPGKVPRPHSPGPRTMHHRHLGATTVVQKGKTGFFKVRQVAASSNRAARKKNATQDMRYRVSLPQKYQEKDFVHFSRRQKSEYKRLKRQRTQSNTFFSGSRPLSPCPSPLSRQTDPNFSRKMNFGGLCLDMLDHRVEDNEEEEFVHENQERESMRLSVWTGGGGGGGGSTGSRSRSIISGTEFTGEEGISGGGSRPSSPNGQSRPSSPVHRTMSQRELNYLRPMTAAMRERSSEGHFILKTTNGMHRVRPLSASASQRALHSIQNKGPKMWAPRHHHPQILGGLSVKTSKGMRKVSKVLRHIPAHRSKTSMMRRASRGGVVAPVSTRHEPHLPVNWGL